MELRKRLTFLFLILIASIFITSSIVIYYWFADFRKSDFYDRMSKKARSVAELLIDIDEVTPQLLKKIEDTKPASLTDVKIVIYDYKNKVIYNNTDDSIDVTQKNLDKIRTDGYLEFKNHNYEVLGLYYKGKYDRVVVVIAAKDTYGLNKLYKLKLILIFVSFFSIILIYFTGLFFVGKALNPIASLIKQVDNITVSNLNERLNERNGKDDLAKLAMTFNRMLERLEQSFLIQKVFIANASHELRTPLTVITGQLEIALIKDRSNLEYIHIFQSVLDDIKNVNQLANRLLLIAQASSSLTNVEMSKIRIDDAVWHARQEIRKMYPAYYVNVFFSEALIGEESFIITGNLLLIRVAINNLMENACKYSTDHSVKVLIDTSGNYINIHFIDTGVGITQDDIKMLFEPFFRGKNTEEIKGHGVGLPLVKSIIDLHTGKITVKSELNVGSEFIISIPLLCNQSAF